MIGKLNLWIYFLLWGTVLIQLFPIYIASRIYVTYPTVKDWSSAWLIFIAAMVSVAIRRFVVVITFDQDCQLPNSFIWDQVISTYVNSLLFWWFCARKERFFLKWFSYDRLIRREKHNDGEKKN